MATYREIHGKAVKSLDTDPSATTDEGQIWYNTASDTFKSIVNLEAWSSAAALIYAQGEGGGGAGTQTAGLIAGGSIPEVATTGEYNGSGWYAGGNMNTAGAFRGLGGTQTAGFCFGNQVASPDFPTGVSETYNGTAWTSISTIPQVHSQSASFGSTTAGVCAAGRTDNGDNATTVTNEWDGSSWSTGGAYPASIRLMGVTGTAPATTGLAFGGQGGGSPSPGNVTTNSSYDGSTWTAQTAIPTATSDNSGAAGTSASALMIGGKAPSVTANCFKYDGTSWTATPSLGTARRSSFGLGSTTAALSAGGSSGPGADLSVTEEFNSSANAITAAAWASGGNLGSARDSGGSAGTQTAGLYYGGYTTTIVGNTESYDGSSWSEVSDLNTAKRQVNQGLGTQTAALAFGGMGAPGVSTQLDGTESWNGSSWTALSSPANLNTGKHNMGCTGTQTAGLKFGGNASYSNATESWNGSAWTSKNALNTGRTGIRGSGTSTAAIGIGGDTPPAPNVVTSVESWDGTNWTASPNSLNTARYIQGCAGPSQTAALVFGGNTPINPTAATAEIYDGSSWATAPSLSTARYNLGGCGTVSAGLAFGGNTGSVSNSTEEYTPESTAVNVKTLTQS